MAEPERTIDLNADVGESGYGRQLGRDDELIPLVSSVNIACGFHGGDPPTLARTVELALQQGVRVGAHPSYEDREGFGRQEQELDPGTLRAQLMYQLAALQGLVQAAGGGQLSHVKLHGALYHRVSKDDAQADAALQAIGRICPGASVVAAARSAFAARARLAGFRVLEEGFVDRRYLPGGELAPRGLPDAVIADPAEAAAQALALAQGRSLDVGRGAALQLRVDTLCIHGDHPRAVDIARAVRQGLEAGGFRIGGSR